MNIIYKQVLFSLLGTMILNHSVLAQSDKKEEVKTDSVKLDVSAGATHVIKKDYDITPYVGKIDINDKKDKQTYALGKGALTLDFSPAFLSAFHSTDGGKGIEGIGSPLAFDSKGRFRPAIKLQALASKDAEKPELTAGAGLRITAKRFKGHLLVNYGAHQVMIDSTSAKTIGLEAEGTYFISNMTEILAAAFGKYQLKEEPKWSTMGQAKLEDVERWKAGAKVRIDHTLTSVGPIDVRAFASFVAAVQMVDGVIYNAPRGQTLREGQQVNVDIQGGLSFRFAPSKGEGK